MKPIEWVWEGEPVVLMSRGSYRDGSPCVEIFSKETEEPVARLTVCVVGAAPLRSHELLVKTWSENEEITKKLLEDEVFKDTGVRVPTGHVEASVWTRPPDHE